MVKNSCLLKNNILTIDSCHTFYTFLSFRSSIPYGVLPRLPILPDAIAGCLTSKIERKTSSQ